MHCFFKIPRPVDRKIQEDEPLLPPLYILAAGESLEETPFSSRNDPRGKDFPTKTNVILILPKPTFKLLCTVLRCVIDASNGLLENGSIAHTVPKISVTLVKPWTLMMQVICSLSLKAWLICLFYGAYVSRQL